ncbi:hypothetical protein Tco_0269880 [Tanacetum coccineum]
MSCCSPSGGHSTLQAEAHTRHVRAIVLPLTVGSEIQKVTQASKHLTDQATELQSQLDSGTLNLKTQRQKISRIISEVDSTPAMSEKLTHAMLEQQSYLSQLDLVKYYLETAQECQQHLLNRREVLGDFEAANSEKTSFKSSIQPENQLDMTPIV